MEALIIIFIVFLFYCIYSASTKSDIKLKETEARALQLAQELERTNDLLYKLKSPVADTVPLTTYETLAAEHKTLLEWAKKTVAELEMQNLETKEKLAAEIGKQRSEQVRLGQVSENLIPFLEGFPYDPKNLRALFQPIDFIMFGEDKIVFLEVKTGNSQMSQKQKNIKRLVETGQVFFETHRLNDLGYTIKKKEE